MAGVYVEVELDEFSDEELLSEMRCRGYTVGSDMDNIVTIEHYWNRGQKQEALIHLERYFPELRGISRLLV
jgi:hypothetical protein